MDAEQIRRIGVADQLTAAVKEIIEAHGYKVIACRKGATETSVQLRTDPPLTTWQVQEFMQQAIEAVGDDAGEANPSCETGDWNELETLEPDDGA